jgi:hypothetical protein
VNRREFVGAAIATTLSGIPVPSRATTEPIRVSVSDADHKLDVENARVFVLGESGRELISTRTDRLGEATIPPFEETERPKYVLVEHPAYFISGLPWRPEADRYYILTTILTVP